MLNFNLYPWRERKEKIKIRTRRVIICSLFFSISLISVVFWQHNHFSYLDLQHDLKVLQAKLKDMSRVPLKKDSMLTRNMFHNITIYLQAQQHMLLNFSNYITPYVCLNKLTMTKAHYTLSGQANSLLVLRNYLQKFKDIKQVNLLKLDSINPKLLNFIVQANARLPTTLKS